MLRGFTYQVRPRVTAAAAQPPTGHGCRLSHGVCASSRLQAIGQLAQRSGAIFQKDISIAERLFAALSTEPPGTRATLQEAVSTLAVAYKVRQFYSAAARCNRRKTHSC